MYRNNYQVKEAVILLEHVVAIKVQTVAEDHPLRLTSQHALTTVYAANDQVKKAVALLEHVVAIQKRTLDEGHPNRVASQQWLAYLTDALDRGLLST